MFKLIKLILNEKANIQENKEEKDKYRIELA